ncbi:MAG: hypothetical protein JRI68_28630 [Deltaproteobacteria bacterium]|nr:hypothetical protein [Deltaproteobacteria bacterium]
MDGPPTDSGLYDEVSGGDAALSSPGLAPPPALSHPDGGGHTEDTAVSTPGFAELSALPKTEAEAGTQDTAVPFSTNPLRAPGKRGLTTKLAVGLALVVTAVGTWALARSQNGGTGPSATAQLATRAELVAATVLGERPPTAATTTASAPTSTAAAIDASAATSVASSAPVVATADRPPRVPPANQPPVRTSQPSKPGKLPAGVYGDVPF